MKPKNKLVSRELWANSGIAGALVFFGTLVGSDFQWTWTALGAAFATSCIVCLTKLQSGMNKKGTVKLFNFV